MNKPSLPSSFLIIVVTVFLILMIGWGVLKLVEKVSDDKNDFDYTSILLPHYYLVDTLIKREEQLYEQSNELTSIFTSKRVLRAPNEQVTSTLKTINV